MSDVKANNLRRFLPVAIFIVMALFLFYMLSLMNQGEYNPRDVPTEFIGKTAPEFSLPDLFDQEKIVSTSEMNGKVWLLNVWATWCRECWREHEYLLLLAQQKNIEIVGLNWRDDMADAKKMLARLGNPFLRVAFDPYSDAVIDWGVYGAPETFLIDEKGIVREKHKGVLNEEIWQRKFAKYFESKTL